MAKDDELKDLKRQLNSIRKTATAIVYTLTLLDYYSAFRFVAFLKVVASDRVSFPILYLHCFSPIPSYALLTLVTDLFYLTVKSSARFLRTARTAPQPSPPSLSTVRAR